MMQKQNSLKLFVVSKQGSPGESFTITNRGKPVADVVPSRSTNRVKIQSTIDSILAAKKHHISDAALAELRSDGRK